MSKRVTLTDEEIKLIVSELESNMVASTRAIVHYQNHNLQVLIDKLQSPVESQKEKTNE